MTPRNLIVLAITLLAPASAAHARPEYFVRPVAQYTWLPSNGTKSSLKHYESPTYPGVYSRNYKASSDSFSGGITAGIRLGQERCNEIGVEWTTARFDGKYTTPDYSGSDQPSLSSPPVPYYIASSTRKCSFSVKTVLFSYRRYFGLRADWVRPYLGVVAGALDYEVTVSDIPSGFKKTRPYNVSNVYAALGLGGGVDIRLGKYGSINAGYRFMHGEPEPFDSDSFYRSAHVFNLGLDLHY